MSLLFKNIVVSFFIIYSVTVYGVESLDKGETHLYVETLDDKKNIDSITYLWNIDGNLKEESISNFMFFSNYIGDKHGALVLPDVYFLNRKNAMSDYGVNTSHKDIINILVDSSCTFPKKKGNSMIIHEDIKKRKCFYFDVSNTPELFTLLIDIRKIILKSSNALNLEIKRNIETITDDFLKKTEAGSGIKNSIRGLIDWLFNSK